MIQPTKLLTTERPKARTASIAAQAKSAAAAAGLLPHEWLLKVCRGEAIEQRRWVERIRPDGVVEREVVTELVYPSFLTRVDAAKACAGYFAPKLVVNRLQGSDGPPIQVVLQQQDSKL